MAYTNPTFCQQSEYMRDHRPDDLPPPPQFQSNDELPPPSPSPPPPPPLPQQQQQQQQQRSYNGGQSNPGFQYRNEESVPRRVNGRYGYLDEQLQQQQQHQPMTRQATFQDNNNYSLSQVSERRPIMHEREVRSRYEYIIDDLDQDEDDSNCQRIIEDDKSRGNSGACTPDQTLLLRNNPIRTSRYGIVENSSSARNNPSNDAVPAVFTYQRCETRKLDSPRYALVPVNTIDDEPTTGRNSAIVACQRSNSTRGRYARVPTQEILDPPVLPDRNIRDNQQTATRHHPDDHMNYSTGNNSGARNNVATQKLHEILTTPRKSTRSRSEERTLSPSKRAQQFVGAGGVVTHRGALTPTGSPSGRYASSPSAGTPSTRRDQRPLLQGASSHRGIDRSPSNAAMPGPHTSTPTKEPSARRCLPLNLDNNVSLSRSRDSTSCPASNCGRQRYPVRAAGNHGSYGMIGGSPGEPPPRYAYLDGLTESIPMVSGSPRYQVVPATDEKSVESAFTARTAVVPPLSPPNSEANTTLASGIEKSERRNAPLLLLLVGILTCGLALYLSWTQGRRYYLDSAAGCGACCALAGACRSLRRTWTGLGLAGLSALSCAGLLLIAAKAPRPGTPLHDVTAGALCGVSLLGAGLALIALVSPKCNIARHRRVHSWIPRFSP